MGVERGPIVLREEHRMRVYYNRVLRNILGPKREEVTVDYRRLQTEDIYDLISSPNGILIC